MLKPRLLTRAELEQLLSVQHTAEVLVDARARLVDGVARLAVAFDAGELELDLIALSTLATICDHQHLPAEAARVRRWMTGGTT